MFIVIYNKLHVYYKLMSISRNDWRFKRELHTEFVAKL